MIETRAKLGGDDGDFRRRLIEAEFMGKDPENFTPLSEILPRRPLKERIWNKVKDFFRAAKPALIGAGCFGLGFLVVSVSLNNPVNLNTLYGVAILAAVGGWYAHMVGNRQDQELRLS